MTDTDPGPIPAIGAQAGNTLAGNTLADWSGNRHEPASERARIVSLVPSITELLFDLGLGTQVVGRTHYCVHPEPAISTVPCVGGTKKIVMERLKALAPTHVIVNVDENPKDMAQAIADLGIAVVVTHPLGPDDNPALYRLIGRLFGRAREAEILCLQLDRALRELRAAAKDWPARKVLYLIWRDPWMTVGENTYIARMLALAGWRNIVCSPDLRYPEITIDGTLLQSVDLVLFSSEPFPFRQTDIAAFDVAFPGARPARMLIDGEMISWYGSRAIQGLGYLKTLAGGFR